MKLQLLIPLLACFVSLHAYSQVIYTDVVPDTTVMFDSSKLSNNGWWKYNNEFNIDMDNDGTFDFNLNIHACRYGSIGECELDISPFDLNEAAVDGSDVLQLNNGDIISNNGTWLNDSSLRLVYRLFDSDPWSSCNVKQGFWNLYANHQFIGVKFYKNQSVYFGWIQLSTNINPASYPGCSFTLEGYAYEASGNSILAGQGTATGISELISSTTCKIFPNPVNQTATVSISDNGHKNKNYLNFELTDVAGKRVALFENVDNSFDLNRQNMKSGLYFYRLLNGNRVMATGKVVFE